MYLVGIRRREDAVCEGGFPWSLPLFAQLEELEFRTPVTFLVGENGSGKSTLLEGLAAGMDAPSAGSSDLADDPTLAAARAFARAFYFARRRRPKQKLFLRAEDVFGYIRRLGSEMAELAAFEEELRDELPEGSWWQARAMGVPGGERRALEARYGANPDARSHGEGFLHLLKERLTPGGLYFLDEPETPLSPARVLALLSLLIERVNDQCQFVIATHSPLLMALPGAEIWLFEDGHIRTVPFDEVEHVRLTRAFLADPQRFLRHL